MGMGAGMMSGESGYGMESETDYESSSSSSATSSAEMSGYGGSGPAVVSKDPADNRYVNDKMEPLTGDQLRTAMKSDSPDDAFLVVAKRMPVRLRVKMNVLKLPLFLSELNNSILPVEVRQIRVNARATSLSSYGGGGGGGGMAPGSMGAMGGSEGVSLGGIGSGEGYESGGSEDSSSGYGYGYGGGGGAASSAVLASIDSPYDSTVEIYGLIYIYNPVDPVKLGLETPEDAAGDTGAITTTPPTGTTTPPTGTTTPPAGTTTPPADTTTPPPAGTTTPPAGTTPPPAGSTTPPPPGAGGAGAAGAGTAGPGTTTTPPAGTTPPPAAGN